MTRGILSKTIPESVIIETENEPVTNIIMTFTHSINVLFSETYLLTKSDDQISTALLTFPFINSDSVWSFERDCGGGVLCSVIFMY